MFIVYDVESTMEIKRFSYRGSALKFIQTHNARPLAVAEVAYYNANVVKKVVRTNLMSGQPFTEASNTPNYMSPASEAYWSM